MQDNPSDRQDAINQGRDIDDRSLPQPPQSTAISSPEPHNSDASRRRSLWLWIAAGIVVVNLLAIGAYRYLGDTSVKAQPIPPAPASLAASSSPSSPTSAQRERILSAVTELEDFRTWAATIDASGSGARPALAILNEPPLTIDGQQYWTVRAFENHSDHVVTWNFFVVDPETSVVLVVDPTTSTYLTLNAWRKSIGQVIEADCKQEQSPAKVFVCSKLTLKALDERIVHFYDAKLKGLTPEATERFSSGQRSWLSYWPKVCSSSADRIVLENKSLPCAIEQFRSRFALLNANSTLLGRHVYDVSYYVALPSDPPDNDNIVAAHELGFPQIDRSREDTKDERLVDAVNSWLSPDVGKWRAGLDSSSNSSSQTSVKDIGTELLTSVDRMEFFGHGAAHPIASLRYRHFVISEARPMDAADILKGNDWEQLLADYAFKELSRRLDDGLLIENAAKLRELVTDTGRWSFGRNGLDLYFEPYAVAPYAQGPQVVTIPWTTLSTYLTARGQRLAREVGGKG